MEIDPSRLQGTWLSLPSKKRVKVSGNSVDDEELGPVELVRNNNLVVYKDLFLLSLSVSLAEWSSLDGSEKVFWSRESGEVLQSLIPRQEIISSSFTSCKFSFYTNMRNVSDDGKWLNFPELIPSSSITRIFVRESYKVILSNILKDGGKTIITGTPGIGKSIFLFYLLNELVKMRRRIFIIYQPHMIYFDDRGRVFTVLAIPPVADMDFWKDDLWCLFDAKQQTSVDLKPFPYDNCRFVLSTSPRRDMVNDFRKGPPPKTFYMPVWAKSELESISCCFSHVKDWCQRFKVLGGIPRYVFEDTREASDSIIRAACAECNLDDCVTVVNLATSISEKSKVVHRLIHMTSQTPFTSSTVRYASATALNIIIEIKGQQARRSLRDLLEAGVGNPLVATLCGKIFEPYAIELLERGGEFQCRKLGNTKPPITFLKIPPSTRLVVDKLSSNQTPKRLHVPKNANHTALDAWIPGIGAFQITVGKNHDLKNMDNSRLKSLGDAANKIYWLLPPLLFNSWTRKKPQKVDQYALLIPYPSVENGF